MAGRATSFSCASSRPSVYTAVNPSNSTREPLARNVQPFTSNVTAVAARRASAIWLARKRS